jgi:CRISPR-associated protein Csh1
VIESVYQIGSAILEEGGSRRLLLESLAEGPPRVKKDGPYIATLKLDTEAKCLDLELKELSTQEYEKSTARYLWLGNAGAAAEQDRLTTNNLGFLVSQTIPSLLLPGRVKPDTALYDILEDLVRNFYFDLGEPEDLGLKGGVPHRRSRRCWDLRLFNIDALSLEHLREEAQREGSAKTVPQKVSREVQDYLGSRLPSEGVLFTLELNGKLLVDDEAYHEYLERSLIGSVFEDSEVGRCHLSGEEAHVTTNMAHFKFKYYITDKQGFASGALQKGFKSSLSLSEESYKSLLIGERFVRREMGFYLAGANGYLLPDLFTLEIPTGIQNALAKTLKGIKGRAELQLGIQNELDQELDDFRREYNASGYMMNLLFYKQNKANFRVLQLIQDVPDYRLQEISNESSKVSDLGGEFFGEGGKWSLDLKNIYYMMPVRKSGTDYLSKSVLGFYANLISGGLIDHKALIGDYIELIRIHRFKNYGAYHLSEPKDPDWELISYVARSNLLTALIRKLNQLKEEEVSTEHLDELELDKTQREYLERLNYGPEQTALYLLGVLIGDIANAQYRLGPNNKGGQKTILNKINYQGMTVSRAQRLATELFDKLNQYRHKDRTPLLDARTEKVYFQAQSLLTERANIWELSPAENVYYLLSGYSHTTFQAIKGKPAKSTANDTGEGAE